MDELKAETVVPQGSAITLQMYGKAEVDNLIKKLKMESIYFEIRKDFDTIVFTLGYPKKTDTERRLVFKNPKIRIDTGKPEWGAEPGKNYFVITWG